MWSMMDDTLARGDVALVGITIRRVTFPGRQVPLARPLQRSDGSPPYMIWYRGSVDTLTDEYSARYTVMNQPRL